MTLPAGTRLGRYEIVARPGAGGTGEVFLPITLVRTVTSALPELTSQAGNGLWKLQ